MDKPEVGQQLFSLNVGNDARNKKQELTPVVVIKVGRKYFYTCLRGHEDCEWMHKKYHIKGWGQASECSQTSQIYKSAEDWNNKKRRDDLDRIISEKFRYGAREVSLSQLERVFAIINEP